LTVPAARAAKTRVAEGALRVNSTPAGQSPAACALAPFSGIRLTLTGVEYQTRAAVASGYDDDTLLADDGGICSVIEPTSQGARQFSCRPAEERCLPCAPSETLALT